MHANAQRITAFYEGFAKQDAGPMRALYAPTATFDDPAFPGLVGSEIGDMWTMLCERAKGFRLEFKDVKADDTTGSAHWEAWYLFEGKRQVHNIIEARFTFGPDGLVTKHVDEFDFYRWSKMALGPAGLLLGWTPFLKKAVQKQARKGLRLWQSKRAK